MKTLSIFALAALLAVPPVFPQDRDETFVAAADRLRSGVSDSDPAELHSEAGRMFAEGGPGPRVESLRMRPPLDVKPRKAVDPVFGVPLHAQDSAPGFLVWVKTPRADNPRREGGWFSDYLVLNILTLAAISSERRVREGVLTHPSFKAYAGHLKGIRLTDGDKPRTEATHLGVGFGWWSYLRSRGYSRRGAAAMVASLGLTREWVMKGWGQPPSLDDPVYFSVGALVGLAAQEVLGVSNTRMKLFPVVFSMKELDRNSEIRTATINELHPPAVGIGGIF